MAMSGQTRDQQRQKKDKSKALGSKDPEGGAKRGSGPDRAARGSGKADSGRSGSGQKESGKPGSPKTGSRTPGSGKTKPASGTASVRKEGGNKAVGGRRHAAGGKKGKDASRSDQQLVVAIVVLVLVLTLLVLATLLPKGPGTGDSDASDIVAEQQGVSGKEGARSWQPENQQPEGQESLDPLLPAGDAETQAPPESSIPQEAQEPSSFAAREPEWPSDPARTPASVPEARPAQIPPGPGKISIVIDDVGYDAGLLTPFLKIPVPITYAVLPQTRDSELSSFMLTGAGKEVILHLPLESVSGTEPGPGTLLSSLSDEELLTLIRRNIESVPGLSGINNHMGSKGTQDERILSLIMQEAAERGLFFLDSRTIAESKVPMVAKRFGVQYLERDVFLDNERDKESIRQALLDGLNAAKDRGYAVMIGHVWTEELAELLLELYPEILDKGYEFLPLREMLSQGLRTDDNPWD